MKSDIALIGLGTMGQSLARNIASKGFKITAYNRTTRVAQEFGQKYGNEYLSIQENLEGLVESLTTPRKIIVMVKAGEAVDSVIESLLPLLDPSDIIIDAGNSNYKDSIRRTQELDKKGLHFVGMGVSGGEEGALKGPSLMPGGPKESWKALRPILEAIAAKDFNGKPCVAHIGGGGAGHYVKMVHNGIEYGVMQMMAESYQVLKVLYGLSALDIAGIFKEFNQGKLKSYLFDISIPVLEKKDEYNEGYLIDFILDKAGQKGTGRWTAIDALKRGVSLPTITLAVFARNISAQKERRVNLSQTFDKKKDLSPSPLASFIKELSEALYVGMISTYAQGFELIAQAAKEEDWDINFAEIARIWEGGCIIRAELLNVIHKAFSQAGKAIHLFENAEIKAILQNNLNAWRNVVSLSIKAGLPIPALASSLTYFEEIISERTSANFIQGLRDYFGAHTYERTEQKGIFHTKWSDLTI